MTQSDPSPTPQGSGGVATGPGSEAGNGNSNGNGPGSGNDADRSASSGDATRRSAPAARSDQAPRRQRVIPPLRKSESAPASEGRVPAQKTAQKAAQTAQKTAEKTAEKAAPSSAEPASTTAQKSAAKKTTLASKAPAKTAAKTARPAQARTSVTGSASSRRPRKARLRLTQIDAWTVMKTAFLLSIALGIVSVVAVAIVWTVLGAAGVFDSLNGTVQTLLGNDFRVQDYIGTGRVLGFTMLLAVVDVVLLTAIATLGAFLYNLSATLLGGVELTLTEDG